MELIAALPHYLFSFIVVLSTIVFVHEFGHYLVARLCGVKIDAFSIGFGKELFGWHDSSGTRWKISALPLGGYVKMYGDASAASNADVNAMDQMPEEERRLTFHHKPLWKKACIVAAGPMANFLLTIGIFTYLIVTTGLASTEPVVGSVLPDTPAAAAGLQPGDRIEEVNGVHMKRFSDIPLQIATNLGTPVDLLVIRSGQEVHITLTPIEIEEEDLLGNKGKRPLIGIKNQDIKLEEVGIARALAISTERTYQLCALTLHAIGQIITGERGVKDLKGPVGIAKLSGQATDKGMSTTLWLIALLSANLGLVNLLPVPVLDGGHLAFYAAEALRGRPLAERVQAWGYRIGFAMIATLMAFTLLNDLRNLFS